MPQDEKPVIVIHEGERTGQRWTIQGDTFLIGRGTECDLVLPERQVSRHHVRIKLEGGQYILEDLDSKNGTWLNGQQIKGNHLLKDADEISLALAVKMSFLETEATAPLNLSHAPMIGGSGRIRLDRDARRVFVNGREVDPPLSLPQYRLLELLLDANGGICTREDVIEAVWPESVSEGISEQAIDALVRRLRDRISEIDGDHAYILTVRGHGFRLELN